MSVNDWWCFVVHRLFWRAVLVQTNANTLSRHICDRCGRVWPSRKEEAC